MSFEKKVRFDRKSLNKNEMKMGKNQYYFGVFYQIRFALYILPKFGVTHLLQSIHTKTSHNRVKKVNKHSLLVSQTFNSENCDNEYIENTGKRNTIFTK